MQDLSHGLLDTLPGLGSPFLQTTRVVGQINGFVSNWEPANPMEIAMLGVSDRRGLPKRVPGARHGLGGI